MRIPRSAISLILALVCTSFKAATKEHEITVTGKLTRAMAIGGESTGWVIALESETILDNRQVSSIEVDSPKTSELEKLENKRVQATGMLSHRQGVETGERMILEISSIKEAKARTGAEPASKTVFKLSGSEWRLEDLGGTGIIDRSQATLTFPEAGKVAGNGSCNRFFGPAELKREAIKLGPLASTRMACSEAVMNQEKKYLNALENAEHFEWKDPYLLIYCQDLEKPLRFTRIPASTHTH